MKTFFQSLLWSGMLLGCILSLRGQNFTPLSPVLPDPTPGMSYSSVNFSYTDANGMSNNYTYRYEIRKDGLAHSLADFEVGTGLSLTPNGQLSGTVANSSDLETGTYFIKVIARINGSSRDSTNYTLFINNCSIDSYKISLVLDASGSMRANTTTGNSRWQEVSDAVMSYVPSLASWMKDSDRLEVVHFQGGQATTIFDNTFGSLDWSIPSTVSTALLGSTNASGGTPLGRGIEVSEPYGTDRHAAIVFTDGWENGCPAALASTGVSCTPPATIGLPTTTFYAIGFAGENQTLLDGLASAGTGDGQSAHTLNTSDLDLLFQTTIPQLFRGCTPRIVTYRTGRFPVVDGRATVAEEFYVDSLVRKLTLLAKCRSGSCRFGEDVRLSLNDITMGRPSFRSPNEIRYDIDLPLIDRTLAESFDGGGKWTLALSGLGASEYDLMVMVDDELLKVETAINDGQPVYVGDPINVQTTANYLGSAFNNLTAEAFLLRPGEDPAKLFAETTIDTPTPLEPEPAAGLSRSSLLAEAKIAELLVDPDIIARLRYQERRIPLTRTSDGRFTGSFPASVSEVAGHYRIVVKYAGYQAGLDSIQGMTIDHFPVRFGRAENINLNETIQYVEPLPTLERVGGYRVSIRPVNQFGNPIGPAQAQNLKVRVNGENLVLEDQLDGTYVGFARKAPEGSEIAIFVLDPKTPVLTQMGSGVSARWAVSVHGGSTSPTSTNAPFNTLSNGYYVEGDLTYKLNRRWQFEVLVGQNNFDPDFNILEVAAYATHTFTPYTIGSYLTPFLKGGLGYMKPDGLDGGLGLGARVGLEADAFGASTWQVEYGLGYAVSPELLFTKVGVGLKIAF